MNPDEYDGQVQDDLMRCRLLPSIPENLDTVSDSDAMESVENANDGNATSQSSDPDIPESMRSRVAETQFCASLEPDTRAKSVETHLDGPIDELNSDNELDSDYDDEDLSPLLLEAQQPGEEPVLASSVRGKPYQEMPKTSTILLPVKLFSRDYQEGPVEPKFKMAPKPKVIMNYARAPSTNVAKPGIREQKDVEALVGNS